MSIKTGIKICIFGLITGLIFVGTIILVVVLIPSVVGAYLSLIVGMVVTGIFISHVCPLFFKDYIKEYWKKQEEKERENEKEVV